MSKKIRVPFEKMPQTKEALNLENAANPPKGSAQEFTNIWMAKVGPNEYLKQLREYHFNK